MRADRRGAPNQRSEVARLRRSASGSGSDRARDLSSRASSRASWRRLLARPLPSPPFCVSCRHGSSPSRPDTRRPDAWRQAAHRLGDLVVERGDRICLVGRNGSGKSTLLKIAAGEIEADRGERFLQPDATVRYLPQEPDLSGFADVFSYVVAGLGPGDGEHRAHYLLDALGLTGDEKPETLSGGEARRAALCRALAPEPDILLLDEPTNHLDLPAIEWLEGELASLRSALVLVSHDRRFLQNLSRVTIWLDRGGTRRLNEGFGAFETWRDAVLEQEERDAQKLDRKIAAEEHWVRYGVTARRKRNVRRMAGLAALRQEKREARKAAGEVRISVAEGKVSGRLVVEAENVSKSFGDRPIVKNFSLRLLRGDRLALVGPNGAGKTTLINLLTGALEPNSGVIRLGTNLQMATLDQRRAALDPNATLANSLTGGGSDWVEINGEKKHVIGYMKDFLFAPEQARTPTGKLSGGERARLLLARALSLPSNFLVLDEPTTISTSKPSTCCRKCSAIIPARSCW